VVTAALHPVRRGSREQCVHKAVCVRVDNNLCVDDTRQTRHPPGLRVIEYIFAQAPSVVRSKASPTSAPQLLNFLHDARRVSLMAASVRTGVICMPPPPLPPSRTNWTRLVPSSVLTGHVSPRSSVRWVLIVAMKRVSLAPSLSDDRHETCATESL